MSDLLVKGGAALILNFLVFHAPFIVTVSYSGFEKVYRLILRGYFGAKNC